MEPTWQRHLLDTRSRNAQRSCFPRLTPVSPTAGTGVKYPPCATQLLSLRPALFYQWFHPISSESKEGSVGSCCFHGVQRAGMPQCHSQCPSLRDCSCIAPTVKRQPQLSASQMQGKPRTFLKTFLHTELQHRPEQQVNKCHVLFIL